MGQCSPQVHFSATCLGITIAQRIAATWGGTSVFTVGVGAGVGGIDQSFLALNKFSEAEPVLGQGVPSQTGALGMSFEWWRVKSHEQKDFFHSGVFLLDKGLQKIVLLPTCILLPV